MATILTNFSNNKESYSKILDDASSLPICDELQRPQTRRQTDKVFLIIFAAAIVLFLPLLIYTLCYSDINRLKPYDKCGNICGQNNVKYDRWSCTGQDMTHKPVYIGDGICGTKKDVEYYYNNPYSVYLNQDIVYLIYKDIWKVVLISFVPLALCLIVVVLFRYVPVRIILITSWVIFTAVGLLIAYFASYPRISLPIAICCIMSVLMLYWILVNLDYIRLTTALLKEATRVIFEVKFLIFVPVGAFLGVLVMLVVYTIVNVNIMTYGKLTEIKPGQLHYVSDNLEPATMIISFITAMWMVLFVLGAQFVAVSGTVAQWYTIKDQRNLNVPVVSQLFTTVKYHLGTVALGSVMTSIMFKPRIILQFLTMFSPLKRKTDYWLRYLDGYFTENSYIFTAINGTSFIQSGKKAANLLKLSIGDTRDVNNFANSAIQITQTIVVFATILVAQITRGYNFYGFNYYSYFFFLTFVLACACAHAILGTLKIIKNTLFFCATEELLRNKEDDMPYTMTMEQFLDGSNKLFLQKIQQRPASNVVMGLYIKILLFVFVSISCLFLVVHFIF